MTASSGLWLPGSMFVAAAALGFESLDPQATVAPWRQMPTDYLLEVYTKDTRSSSDRRDNADEERTTRPTPQRTA